MGTDSADGDALRTAPGYEQQLTAERGASRVADSRSAQSMPPSAERIEPRAAQPQVCPAQRRVPIRSIVA
jgi:hypothetical protein